jgi:IclR family transcriptional regulator, mhp operon transcriptional activator
MESTRPIRALMRGLDALTVLNVRDGASVSEVAHEIHLPRTTVYRILETLCNAGFAFRDAADDRYRLTIRVRALSEGFGDEAWVSQIAKPVIHELGREIVWPVAIATLSGSSMLLRESTDYGAPQLLERHSAGSRAPLLSTAAGVVVLANASLPQRDALIEILAASNKEEDKPARLREELLRTLGEVRSVGYATTTLTRRLTDEFSLSVPVLLDGAPPAALTVRFSGSTVPLKTGIERFLPKLRRSAAKITSLFLEQRAPAQPESAPAAA